MKNVEITPIPYGTEDWYRFRNWNGIGGSEIPLLFGWHSRYDSEARLYNIKIGRFKDIRPDSEATFWGRELEKTIKDKWMHYHPKNGYIENYRDKKIIRKYSEINGFAVNKKYPYLFASTDGIIEDGFSLLNGETVHRGILECKTGTSLTLSHYANGIDPAYIFQIHLYFLVFGLDYGEIVLLKDGRYLSVFPIERSDSICQSIEIRAKNFWYNKVLPGREAYKNFLECEKKGDITGMSHYLGIVDSLEPTGDGGQGYSDLMNEHWRETNTRIPGDYKNFNRAIFDKKLLEIEKIIKKERKKNQQMLMRELHHKSADYFDFENGYYRVYKRGGDIVNDNRIKTDINLQMIESATQRAIREVINETIE